MPRNKKGTRLSLGTNRAWSGIQTVPNRRADESRSGIRPRARKTSAEIECDGKKETATARRIEWNDPIQADRIVRTTGPIAKVPDRVPRFDAQARTSLAPAWSSRLGAKDLL